MECPACVKSVPVPLSFDQQIYCPQCGTKLTAQCPACHLWHPTVKEEDKAIFGKYCPETGEEIAEHMTARGKFEEERADWNNRAMLDFESSHLDDSPGYVIKEWRSYLGIFCASALVSLAAGVPLFFMVSRFWGIAVGALMASVVPWAFSHYRATHKRWLDAAAMRRHFLNQGYQELKIHHVGLG